ncbi:stage V sporulation protein AC [Bacillus subtilis]|jgi:stage V sporulation protein AC|uniref:Stage V sporulation protein AC n=9 Tax=Bacillus TaxID=1386 RepID=SP5AC_BACSU|nr:MULTISPECIES: stage V sporulation protein AC [Bacillales]NP_390223.1 mechanosensitive channel; stage V sporulation protein AC [Bacillus subtilis subsp. subtilis str. 168]P40868.1 RecName: Full=Stage V sporulation protein AC [Bacillus subtilis subsp. subtilis str. 168]AUZ26946.1 stage V sporulation protein AC [Bacillus cereus]KFI03329.1 stage V sporulation protein AC [Bacillus sp. BSC154]MBU8842585.1 stage V sporulation protein AC [Alkalicoccobacillus gibsonii]MDP4112247.1 stage V sporulati
MTNIKENYKSKVKTYQPKPPYVWNCVKAFLVGGLICAIGQGLQNFYIHFFDFNEKTAGNPTAATLILISALLTGFGIYDRIGQFAGAGSAVPVTGFANSMASAALEYKSEGLVLGVATNMFKLAGNVIVFGVVAAYIVGMIRFAFEKLMS